MTTWPSFLRFVWEQILSRRISLHPGYLLLLVRTLRSAFLDIRRLGQTGKLVPDREMGRGFRVQMGGCRLHADSFDDLLAMREVFHDKAYELPLERDTVVLDVGMHLGYASLYFAAQSEVCRVYAFEPCEPTLEAARRQLAENPSLSEKIETFGFGLSDADQKTEWPYSFQWKGSVGRYGLSKAMLHSPDTKPLQVTLRRASMVRELLDRHPGASVLLKLDCEGSEGPILEELEKADLLGRISKICLEWHEGEVAPLMDILHRNGYTIVSHTDLSSANNGLMKAVRNGDHTQ